MKKSILFIFIAGYLACVSIQAQQLPAMYYIDSSRVGKPLAKDPKIVFFKNKYWMYYSIPETKTQGWGGMHCRNWIVDRLSFL